MDLASLLDRFAERRDQEVAWLRTLEPAALERLGTHDEAGTISAGNVFHYRACHDQIHLRQLSKQLQALAEPYIGNTRLFFEDV